MIRFTLACENKHSFDSWFQSGEAFESLKAAGHLSCSVCGSSVVEKSLMAPSVVASDRKEANASAGLDEPGPLEQLRNYVETNSDYVGMSFAQEAREMHEGLIPPRSIYGQARVDEARKLIDDGVPVLPLPFVPRKQTN